MLGQNPFMTVGPDVISDFNNFIISHQQSTQKVCLNSRKSMV